MNREPTKPFIFISEKKYTPAKEKFMKLDIAKHPEEKYDKTLDDYTDQWNNGL